MVSFLMLKKKCVQAWNCAINMIQKRDKISLTSCHHFKRLFCRHSSTRSRILTSISFGLPATFYGHLYLSFCLHSCSKQPVSHLCKLTQVCEPSPSNIHRVCTWQTQSDESHTKKIKKIKLASDGGCRQKDRQGVSENKINAAETNVQKKSVTLSSGWVFVTATLNSTWENWKPACCVTPVFSTQHWITTAFKSWWRSFPFLWRSHPSPSSDFTLYIPQIQNENECSLWQCSWLLLTLWLCFYLFG